jgi:hypothetical protein
VDTFQNLATPGNASDPRELLHLSREELECYVELCRTNQRLEQEHLPIDILVNEIERIEKPPSNVAIA